MTQTKTPKKHKLPAWLVSVQGGSSYGFYVVVPVKPVGPLPPAVYWGRRALVLAPILVLLLILATCMAKANGSQDSTSDAAKPKSLKQSLPKIQDGSKEHPFYPTPGSPPAGGPTPATQAGPAPAPPTAAPPPPSPTGPTLCADGDLRIEVTPEHANYPVGSRLKIKLVIINTSNQDCLRDVGAGQQEISANAGPTKVWSSDHCASSQASDQRTLKKGTSITFWVVWTGVGSAPGCPKPEQKVTPGQYQIVGRLGTAVSQGATVTLR